MPIHVSPEHGPVSEKRRPHDLHPWVLGSDDHVNHLNDAVFLTADRKPRSVNASYSHS